ncbi:hypothetical protein TrLO_g15103, partial [Triparma laevis f. longispina]
DFLLFVGCRVNQYEQIRNKSCY